MIRITLFSFCVLASSACGVSSKSAPSSDPRSVAPAERTAAPNGDKSFLCVDQYFDRSLQERALWEEGFEAVVSPGRDGTTKAFGVSPGNGKYLAWVGLNGNEGFAFRVTQQETGVGAMTIVTDMRISENATVIYTVTKDQFFVLSCTRK